MDSGTIKTPIEMIKEGAFGGTSFILVLMVSGIENPGRSLMT